jgi:hypothetical protein
MSITFGGDVSGAGICAVSASCHAVNSARQPLSPENHKKKKEYHLLSK